MDICLNQKFVKKKFKKLAVFSFYMHTCKFDTK